MTSSNPWKLRFALPLGFPTIDRPHFLETLGTADQVEQIRYMAELGFAGVQDNRLKSRPIAEQTRIGDALAKHGLEMGCFLNSRDDASDRRWIVDSAENSAEIMAEIEESIEVARRVNGRNIVLSPRRDLNAATVYQFGTFIDNLRRVVEPLQKAGLTLCLEHVNELRLPGLLLRHYADSVAVTKAVNSPAVKIVYDTMHVQAMDGNLITHLERSINDIGVVQIADVPGRFEPGTGEINFVNLFRRLRSLGYAGLVEMEHFYSMPGKAGEEAALQALRDINDQIY
jgi:hydroxypyruvate isomerase